MATSKRKMDDVTGFDVTCTIGRVTFGEGDVSPMVAAFQLIGEYGGNGAYQFPAEDGGIMHVDVQHEPNRENAPNGF